MTSYSYIYDELKDRITDYDLVAYSEGLQEELLASYLRQACRKFSRICTNDLSAVAYDEEGVAVGFEADLTPEEIDIIVEWMVVMWLTPLRNDLDNLRNRINTAEFSSISPANMQIAIEASYEASRKRALSLMNKYSYIEGDFKQLVT